ncbi:hypothetical protein ACF06X_26270 [Streptomyces sp. NPDC015346]|uniref:hypothetical protein n=1 Tax=Streptomyces sp. NPDC015346 TaxID=3364954 RepID=UPI0036FAFF9D
MRPAQDITAGQSATPIYDALYSEYRRSFRTLPGDRSGEEDLAFRSFGTPVSTGLYGQGQGHGGSRYASQASQASHTAHPVAWSAQHHSGLHHTPAALPPAPRRGL